jgi:tRNA-2-methylthio-N6-dimethylallyladenosine synthase
MSSGRFFIETWGCQMNELDSQRLAGQLMQQGLLPTRKASEAEVILLNSCSVREKAEQKVYSRLGEYRLLKQENPRLLIGLCGCVAQQEGQRALDRVKDLDFVLGTGRVGELRSLLSRVRSGERVLATGFPADRLFDPDAIARDGAYKGMVTIVEGCNQRCTFCVVPSTRGPERSRTLAEIVGEVAHLVDFGFREIELLGQTVNHWRDPLRGHDFADLLDAVAQVSGVERLRFVTSYPKDFSHRMIEQVARHENICPYLHLPVQSGSDAVLRRMGRGYGAGEYRQLVADLRAARQGLSISTDIIVGFPGETPAEFEASLELVREVRFGALYAFKYSPRPHTAAPRLGPPVEQPIADQRLERLLDLQTQIQRSLNEGLVGRTMEVLVTGWGKDASVVGRTTCHRVVNFAGREGANPGRIVPVRIERAFPHSLAGCAL